MIRTCPFALNKVLLSIATMAVGGPQLAHAQTVDLGTVGGSSGAATQTSVNANTGTAAAVAPTQANLNATQPQSVISRAFIENSTPPTGNFNTILAIAPSVAATPATNGPGLSDQKMTLRGFQDGEYNVTFDGIPFGDANGPTHHSTAYFPASVIGGMVVERGPGNASNLGYSTYGGSVNMFSKTPSATRLISAYTSIGSWGTNLEGVAYESGRMEGSDATLQANLQRMDSNGYLTHNAIASKNLTVKYQRPLGDSSLLTLFSTINYIKTDTPDNVDGTTVAQVAALGKNYSLNDDPKSQGYWGYNTEGKRTDMDYVRIQSSWGAGWETDNNLYSYAYTNHTLAGQDPTQFNGTADASLTFADMNKKKVTLPNGDVPGYDKLNAYRVWGDILKATKQVGTLGLLRTGLWFERADTSRHNYEQDMTTGQVLPGVTDTATSDTAFGVVTKSNFDHQRSGWHQYQPFVEFEWNAAPGLTVTPGYKYMVYDFHLDSAMNQKALTPQHYDWTYHASLPFLTVNQKLGSQDSVYGQFAKGMQLVFLGAGTQNSQKSTPETTTNLQLGAVHKSDALTVDADVYLITVNNLEENTGTTQLPDYMNVGGAVYKGAEAEATYVVGYGFAAYANVGLNDANYRASNADKPQAVTANYIGEVPNAPKVTYSLGELFKQGNWDESLMYKHVGTQCNVKLGTTSKCSASTHMPAVDTVDLNASYTFTALPTPVLKRLKVQLSVFNLTNHRTLIEADAPLASSQSQWEAPRSFMASIKADF